MAAVCVTAGLSPTLLPSVALQMDAWFGYLTAQKIRRGVHKSVQALEAGIRAWIQNWNQNPRPFAWTKTADEILDSLAKYIAKISGAAY